MRSYWWAWALCGVAAAAMAIGAGELAGALFGGISLIAGVGALVIDLQPPGAKDLMVALFGENDKLVLELSTGIGGLLVGALLGLAGRRDIRLAMGGFAAFAIVGFLIVLRDPLADTLSAAIIVLVAAGTGIAVLPPLLRLAGRSLGEPPAESVERPPPESVGRRRFLAVSGATLAVGALMAFVGRYLTLRLPPVAAPEPISGPVATLPPLPAGTFFDIPDLAPIIVPNDDFYRIDTRLTVPRLDAETWSLRIHGMVDREVVLSYRELQAMSLVERYVTIACVSNEVGGYLVGNARWTGVPLLPVLQSAGVHADASQVVGRSYDGWTSGFPTAHLSGGGREAMIVLQMNGEVLPAAHGFPARLIVPGLYGYVSATKWLTEIEMTTLEGFDAYWVPKGWAKQAPILTQSRIDVPLRNVREGRSTVAGVAWAPTRGISKVEVQLDDGPWQAAQLSVPLSDASWVQWNVPIDFVAGTHTVRVRATDGTGELQAIGPTPPAPDGARGWHQRQVVAS